MSSSTCPICFEALHDKIKASPDNCDHKFCLQCLERWAKLGSYCPVDRKRFKKILNLQTDSLIQVKSHKRKRKRIVYDFTSHCEICSGTTDANVLLLCDCCDLGYHIHCLTPPLKEVPAGLWFCPTCIAVEEKLKKQNGITKEVEAEIGGFDNKLLYKNKSREKVINENELPVKAKNADNSTSITKNTSVLQACYDIINKFEDMDVRKNCCKDGCSSSYLDSAINKIDKIYKTFGTASKTSISKHSENLKTYSVTNTYLKTKRIKSFDVEKNKKSHAESVRLKSAESCLKNNISSDSNLHNHTVTTDTYHVFINNSTLYDENELFSSEENGKEYGSPIHNNQINLYSETDDMSDEICENSLQRKSYQNFHVGQIFEDLNTSKSENELVIQKNGKRTPARKSFENCMNESAEISKKKKHNEYAIASYYEDSIPSSSSVRNKPSKGTIKNLIQFSVFQRVEGIDASQEIYSQISSVDKHFSLNILPQNCSMCNDKPKIQCKVCQLKYFKVKESKKFSNYVKNFKKGLDNAKNENIYLNKMRFELKMLETGKNVINRNAFALERRKRSLIHKLKKIHNSKCISIIPVN